MEKVKTTLVVLSVVLNVVLGYFFAKMFVYQAGVNAGLQLANTQIQQAIAGGQIVVPKQEAPVISEETKTVKK